MAVHVPRGYAGSSDVLMWPALKVAYAAILLLALLETIVGVLSAAVLLAGPAGPVVAWRAVINVALFAASGALLIVGGSKDWRVRLLGGLFLIIASAFADGLTRGVDRGVLAWAGSALRAAPPESFFAMALWLFARAFPLEPSRRAERVLSAVFVLGSAALGAILFTVNVALEAARAAPLRKGILAGWRRSIGTNRRSSSGRCWSGSLCRRSPT